MTAKNNIWYSKSERIDSSEYGKGRCHIYFLLDKNSKIDYSNPVYEYCYPGKHYWVCDRTLVKYNKLKDLLFWSKIK